MKNLILSTALLCSSLSYAATQTTQTLVPGAGQIEFQIGLGLTSSIANVDFTGGSMEAKGTGFLVADSFYYGIAEGSAIGIQTSYGSLTSDTDTTSGGSTTTKTSKSSGLGDVLLNYKGNFDLGGPSLYVSAGYQFGLETAKDEDKSATESESNRTSDQPALVLRAGIVHPVSDWKIGAILGYDYAFEGKSESTAVGGTKTNYTITKGGGTNLTAFAEMENYYHPNFALIYSRSYTYEGKAANGSSSGGGSELIGLGLSGRMEMASNFEFIPTFTYATLLDKTMSGFEFTKYDIYTVNFAARFLF